jgi:ribosomal protein L29
MKELEQMKEVSTLSVEKIIDLIRALRNELVKDVLKDEELSQHYKTQFNKELSNIKKEFLKRDLRELLISPVDLVHYAGLINQMKETGTASITEKNHSFFYHELNGIFKKYSI